MRFVFGPVPSRRLGQSLGIDPIPLKTCNWNCVYCQLGRSIPLRYERREYVPRQDVVVELEQALGAHDPGEIDWVTFVGSGEPTLHVDLGWMIRRAKELTDLPVAVITNGALLYDPELREDLAAADAVLPSLDAGTAKLYRKINRPHPSLPFDRYVEGLASFRAMYPGKLWVEVMLVKGLNDSEEALQPIVARLDRIRPDAVHLNLPTRPPAEAWVIPPDQEGLMRVMAMLGNIAEVVHPAEGTFDLGGRPDVIDAVAEILKRHPMQDEELQRALARWGDKQSPPWSAVEVARLLERLATGGRARRVDRHGQSFWTAYGSHYADARNASAEASTR
jgi:wyosine [tRNA(Phe)-imidazoG37] synthetase (radical SAM superfamily)